MTTILTAAQATARLQGSKRALIDAACTSGALKAADLTPDSSRRSWRILETNFVDWVERGCPRTEEVKP